MKRDGAADRKTAERCIATAEERGVARATDLSDELVAEVSRRIQSRQPPQLSAEWRSLEANRGRVEAWLTAQMIRCCSFASMRSSSARAEGVKVGYTTLRRYAHQELGWRERVGSVRVDEPPRGEEAQVDFGQVSYVSDNEGHRHRLLVLVVVLTMIRYTFVWPTFVQASTPSACSRARCRGPGCVEPGACFDCANATVRHVLRPRALAGSASTPSMFLGASARSKRRSRSKTTRGAAAGGPVRSRSSGFVTINRRGAQKREA
ncbi:hypothetical protein [Sorangium sp. So ce176]|uniref:hypothetical protein n=1 Tax=Sorangium sp. So ce176 TaxID=3133286 RepID=UPI003F5FA306